MFRPEQRPDTDVRLLIVDDHPVVRDGMRGMLELRGGYQVVAEAASRDEAIATLQTLSGTEKEPHVVITDMRMPGHGAALIAEIRRLYPRIGVLVLSAFSDEKDVSTAFSAGALGYVVKESAREDIFTALAQVAAGQTYMSLAASQALAEQLRHSRTRENTTDLVPREKEILSLLAEGLTNQQIASQLFIGVATVKTHLGNLYRKLGVSDRAGAVSVGYRRGLIST